MLPHLLECRRRLLQIIACFVLLFMIFFFIAPNLFHALVYPLLAVLPIHDALIATDVTTPLLTPMKLAANAAMLCTAPFALLHAWCFVSPGLYRHERTLLRWAIVASLILFICGILFGFYLVLPWMFSFFAHAIPSGVRFMPDMGTTVDFITHMLLVFGLFFQIPLLCWLFVRLGILTTIQLKLVRPYVIVLAFFIGMLLTPPDVFSQILLAVPLCLLYETGIFFARFI